MRNARNALGADIILLRPGICNPAITCGAVVVVVGGAKLGPLDYLNHYLLAIFSGQALRANGSNLINYKNNILII